MHLGQQRDVDIDHVAGGVIFIGDVRLQFLRDRQMLQFEPARIIGRRHVEIAAGHEQLHLRILLHRDGEVGKDVGQRDQRAADAGLLLSVTADSVIRLVPPLILSMAEADEIVAILVPIIEAFLKE